MTNPNSHTACKAVQMVLSVYSRRIAALFDAERLFLDSSAVKKRTFIPVVGDIILTLFKEATACVYSAACMI